MEVHFTHVNVSDTPKKQKTGAKGIGEKRRQKPVININVGSYNGYFNSESIVSLNFEEKYFITMFFLIINSKLSYRYESVLSKSVQFT